METKKQSHQRARHILRDNVFACVINSWFLILHLQFLPCAEIGLLGVARLHVLLATLVHVLSVICCFFLFIWRVACVLAFFPCNRQGVQNGPIGSGAPESLDMEHTLCTTCEGAQISC